VEGKEGRVILQKVQKPIHVIYPSGLWLFRVKAEVKGEAGNVRNGRFPPFLAGSEQIIYNDFLR
jgi:hypothetical protein